ncbi:MAG: class I SAM-dependent methyltransferase, partial [Deltaproteobacteria bacterium]|nr:class I SAM-dependent methyltransferase [Deltaproteobacteria bacterium]
AVHVKSEKVESRQMPHANRMSFRMMSFIHETLYGLFRNPDTALNAAGLELGQEVLEVGCGPGFFTVPAARIVGEAGMVLSLDVNPLAVEHVQRKIDREGVSNVKIMLSNVTQTGLPGQGFDVAFLFGLARPVGNMDTMWSELHRLLKPEGTLSIEGRLRPPKDLFEPVRRQGRISRYRKLG